MNRDEFLDAVEAFVGPDTDTGSWDVLLDALDEYTREVRRAAWDEGAAYIWPGEPSREDANPYREKTS